MEDFNPITMFAILRESLGPWLWGLLLIALVLVVGVVSAAMKLRSARRSPKHPIIAAALAGGVATAIFFMLVPGWTMATHAALNGPVDYLAAILIAFIPGGGIAAMVFSMASWRCARRTTAVCDKSMA